MIEIFVTRVCKFCGATFNTPAEKDNCSFSALAGSHYHKNKADMYFHVCGDGRLGVTEIVGYGNGSK
jgi:hypothetical protein